MVVPAVGLLAHTGPSVVLWFQKLVSSVNQAHPSHLSAWSPLLVPLPGSLSCSLLTVLHLSQTFCPDLPTCLLHSHLPLPLLPVPSIRKWSEGSCGGSGCLLLPSIALTPPTLFSFFFFFFFLFLVARHDIPNARRPEFLIIRPEFPPPSVSSLDPSVC